MDNLPNIILVLSLMISLLMSYLSFLSYKKHKNRELLSYFQLWISMSLNVLFMMVFYGTSNWMTALSMLGWIWPARTLNVVLKDFSQKQVLNKIHFILMGVGAFISFTMVGYGFDIKYSTIPFSILVGGLGLYAVVQSIKLTSKRIESPLLKGSFLLIGLFYFLKITFPIWRLDSVFKEYGFAGELFFLAGFAGTGLEAYLEIIKKRQDGLIEKVLKERSEKFIGQSKFSELGMLSAGIAHEINNPLAVIMARTSQLLRIYHLPEKKDDVGEGLQQIYRTCERINKTIQGVREFVHQDDNGPTSEVNLKELFDSVLAFCGQRMKNHGINLRLYGLEYVSVRGHKVQLEQVILNLFNNSFDAIEFLPDKWIEVSCHQKDNKIQLYFKDSGHGIPSEIASRIMEPFFSTKEVGKGTGLGLSLAQGIAQKHLGSLQYLKDRPFTTFLLELPKAISSDWSLPLQ